MTHARKHPNAKAVLTVSTRRLDTPGTEKLSHGTIYERGHTLVSCTSRVRGRSAVLQALPLKKLL